MLKISFHLFFWKGRLFENIHYLKCFNQKRMTNAHLRNFRRIIDARRFSFYNNIPFYRKWEYILLLLSPLSNFSTGNELTIYHDTGIAFDNMWQTIDGASQGIFWQTYICKDDSVGRKTLTKLQDAQCRGVQTELLYDCGGNLTGRTRLVQKLKEVGGTVICHRPCFSTMFKYFWGGMKGIDSPALRNHRKILIIDKRIAFCGGLNIGDDYCSLPAGGNGMFRDTHCRIVGPAVNDLLKVYEDTKISSSSAFLIPKWTQLVRSRIATQIRQTQVFKKEILQKFLFHQQINKRGHDASTPGVVTDVKAALTKKMLIYLRNHDINLEFGEGLKTPLITDATFSMKATRDSIIRSLSLKRKWRLISNVPSERSSESLLSTSSNSGLEAKNSTNSKCPKKPKGAKKSFFRSNWKAFREQEAFQLSRSLLLYIYSPKKVISDLKDSDPVPEAEKFDQFTLPMTQILMSNPKTRHWSIQYAFWQVTRKAHRRVWITTPYYLPYKKLFFAMIRSARRGVDIRLLAGSRQTTDPWFMYYVSKYITTRLLESGVRIYEYHGTQIMHAKTVVVDSIWSSIGSYNWDMMSNRNMEVCVTQLSFKTAREMEAQFLRDLSFSSELQVEETRNGILSRFLSVCFYWFFQGLEKLAFLAYDGDNDMSIRVD